MLQLHDSTPFTVGVFALPDPRGVDTLVVVIKASFDMPRADPGTDDRGPAGLAIAECQRPLVMTDEYWGSPDSSSLRYPSEVHPQKPGTDVLVIAEACAPGGHPVTELEVGIRVGDRDKRARVYGDRHWTEGVGGLKPSRPRSFVRLPLTYERAFGGREPAQAPRADGLSDGLGLGPAEPSNPVGVGFIHGAEPRERLGHPVPNIDDPDQPFTRLGQSPAPMGFGASAPHWTPRRRFAGTYDERWSTTRAPHLPLDFDPRFFNAASAGLNFAQALRGGEPIVLFGMAPEGPHGLTLPTCHFDLGLQIAGAREPASPILDTVILEPSDAHLTMIWRAVVPVSKRLLQVERIDLALAELQGAQA